MLMLGEAIFCLLYVPLHTDPPGCGSDVIATTFAATPLGNALDGHGQVQGQAGGYLAANGTGVGGGVYGGNGTGLGGLTAEVNPSPVLCNGE